MTRLFRYRAGVVALFAAAAFAQSPVVFAAPQARTEARAAIDAGKTTPKERGELTRQFVTKWGMYVQRIYNVPVGTWAKRMVPNFVAADAYKTISEGRRGSDIMPPWGNAFTPEQIWELVAYIQFLSKQPPSQ